MIRWIQNIALVLISLFMSLAFGEVLLRIVLNPGDFLEANLVDDPRYGYRIAKTNSTFDAWGFRNKSVPTHADLVTIGDSQTYGVAASADQSWPAHLSRLWSISTYNASVGGYGPIQYRRVLTDYALPLNPQLVLFGLYFGNDLVDGFNFSYLLDEGDPLRVVTTPGPEPERLPMFPAIRQWFAYHSVLYNFAKFNLESLTDFFRLRESRDPSPVVVRFNGFASAFTPLRRLQVLDPNITNVKIGRTILEREFASIQEACSRARVRCGVVLIPTKESVYYNKVRDHLPDELRALFMKVVSTETLQRLAIQNKLEEIGLPTVDPLPLMRAATLSQTRLLYPAGPDGHPNQYGYSLIAQAVAEQIEQPNHPAR